MTHHASYAVGHAIHHAAYVHTYAGAGGGWFMHAVVNGVIHAAIYRMIAPLFRGQGVFGSLLIGVGMIALTFLVWRWWTGMLPRRRRT